MAIVDGTDSAETLDAADGVTNNFDSIKGYGGSDTIFGLGGNDEITGGSGADTIDGGMGTDTAMYFDSAVGVMVSLITGRGFNGTAQGDRLTSIENVIGSFHADILIGSDDKDNVLTGLDGDDVINGGGGRNTLNGDIGNDILKGGAGADALNGGSGIDTADYSASSERVYVNLRDNVAFLGDADGDRFDSIENLIGSNFNDSLYGNDDANTIKGRDGVDTLIGFNGADVLWGGDGGDNLYGWGAGDTLYGEAGDDTLDAGWGDGDAMYGGTGNDTYYVDLSTDVVSELVGQGTLDRVIASATYTLAAGSEVERLEAYDPAWALPMDLVGNEFNNTIIGNDDTNTIVGSPDDGDFYDGLDVMTGNGAGDVFVWTSTAETGVAGAEADVVTDFNRSQGDQLAVNAIDAIVGGSDDAFTFIGVFDGAFEAAGQIAYFTTATATDTYILLNTDADAAQEATIRLMGVHTVDFSWFAL
jgi:Ca2+-binding RTX toxin-like protein